MSEPVTYDPFLNGELEASFATTEVQQELWIAAQRSAEANCAYNQIVQLDLPAAVNEARLSDALTRTALSHSMLRASFSRDGEFCNIEKSSTITLHVDTDSSHQAILDNEATTPFDLQQTPLWRATLSTVAERKTLFITTHHIVADGWSTGIWLTTLADYYNHPDQPVTTATPFTEHVRWLRAPATQDAAAEDLQYWQQQFSQHSDSPGLPTLQQRDPGRDFAVGFTKSLLGKDDLATLTRFAREQRVTLSTLLTSAFAMYLGNLNGAREIVVGVPAAGQLDSDMGDLVGHCVNTLPYRTEVDHQQSFSAQLQQCRAELLNAYQHQKLTFGTLLRATPALRSVPQLVPLLFNVEAGEFTVEFAGEQSSVRFPPRAYDHFDLMFNCAVLQDGLAFEVHYNQTLYSERQINARIDDFAGFLKTASGAPETPVAELSLLSNSDRETLAALNNTTLAATTAGLLESIDTHPADAVAVIDDQRQLDYRALAHESRCIAGRLVHEGVSNGDIVAVMVPRSADMIVALLGILRSGAAYLPIDTTLPESRIAYMLDDADVHHVICGAGVSVPGGSDRCAIPIADALGHAPQTSDFVAASNDTAYVIYTSGSTGKPKGVVVSHAALHNFLDAMAHEPGATAQDCFLSLTTLSFDISVLEIWLPLLVGARTVVVSRADSQDGRAISRIIADNDVTVVQATPSSWHLMLASGWQGNDRIRAIVGGEPVTAELTDTLAPLTGELWNAYGPTEATVWVLLSRLHKGETPAIGKPIANTQVHIISRTGCVLPIGMTGEIVLSGQCLAQGYLNREQLTNERFRYHSGIGARIYHTGDLGYIDERSGQVMCLGRSDDQIKLRGHRIEPGEIAAVFNEEFAIEQAVAVVTDVPAASTAGPAQQNLAVVYQGEALALDDTAIRERLRQFLPEYMMPLLFIATPALPLTANGKIDRRAASDIAGSALNNRRHAASTETVELTEFESLALGVFVEALGHDSININDNFFDVGGHSLLAMKIAIELGDLLDIEVPVILIFDHPVIADFATALEAELTRLLSNTESQHA